MSTRAALLAAGGLLIAGGTPHLHYPIRRGNPADAWWVGVPVNPYPLLVP